jgi:hypothetical protein
MVRAWSYASESVVAPPRSIESRSGAIAMNPSAASWSATDRTQVERPKISWITTTTGAFCRRSGYTTNAAIESAEPDASGTIAHSAWRVEACNRAAAWSAPGAMPAGWNAGSAPEAVMPMSCSAWPACSSAAGDSAGTRCIVQAPRRKAAGRRSSEPRMRGLRWRADTDDEGG